MNDTNIEYNYSINWRDTEYITPVYQQYSMPTCWAAAVADSITIKAHLSKLTIAPYQVLPSLSVQELVDWLPYYKREYAAVAEAHRGVYFAEVLDGFEYVKKNGVHIDPAYPCRACNDTRKVDYKKLTHSDFSSMIKNGIGSHYAHGSNRITIDDFKCIEHRNISHEEFITKIIDQLKFAPVVGGIDLGLNFGTFNGQGIYNEWNTSPHRRNHAVVITGYGYEAGRCGVHMQRDFFEIKNSEGPHWADHGYAKIDSHLIYVVYYPGTPALWTGWPTT